MKIFRVILCFAFLGISINLYSQISGFKKDNVLLPDKLIISEHIGNDSLYLFPLDSFQTGKITKPFFEIDKKFDFLKMLVRKAMKSTINAYDVNQYDENYPYSALEPSKQLTENEVLKLLGQDTLIMLNDDWSGEERKVVKVVTLEDLTSVNFIEDWSLSVNPLKFTKNVYAIEPVRRTDASDDNGEYRYRKVFRCYNKPSEIGGNPKLKLAATVKYEYFFNLEGTFQNNYFGKMVEMCFQQNEKNIENNLITNSAMNPFFNQFNQRIFISTLLSNVFSGKVKTKDFYCEKILTPEEARERVFEKVTVKVVNTDTWQDEDRIVENDNTYQIVSVIFIEEWYFDEESLRFEKKVTGIAPVRYYYDMVDEKNVLKRKVIFTINLD